MGTVHAEEHDGATNEAASIRGYTVIDSENPTSPSQPGQCSHLKPDGSYCKANVRLGSSYCFFHDPESAAERQAAQISGGKERSRRAAVLPADTPDRQLTNAGDVTALLGETINQVRRGQLDPRFANAIGYLATIFLKARETDGLEQRVERLESVLASQKTVPEADPEFEFVSPAAK